MTEPAQVAGRAFLGIVSHIKNSRGPDALTRIVKEAGPATQLVFASPISIREWHPYEAFIRFLESIERVYGEGDPRTCRDIGFITGKRDLGTILKIYVALASAERLIRSCASVWPTYYRNAGRMEATSWQPDKTALRIFEFDRMDTRHCRLMEGWMIGAMESIGYRVENARESACTSRGAQHHEFSCTWTRARPSFRSPEK